MNVAKDVAAMRRMSVTKLKAKYEEVFGEACRSGNKVWLIKRIAWRMQANAEGDLSERARRRAAELADDADLRMKAPRAKPTPPAEIEKPHDGRIPMPGGILTRIYKGETVQVTVLDDGFEYLGQAYPSLSAAAKAITGSHTNGFLFFRLG